MQTSLALFYNDYSVLEQHHCCVAFKLLLKSDSNILVNLDPTQYRLLRKYVCACILATDLTSHGEWSSKLKVTIQLIICY
jgi:high affinity cGMP-specific 3',5'-cyclic phosphodiesterase 9